jgi:Flp pilus assembly protein protease CpaA
MPNKEENSGISSGKFPRREIKGIPEFIRMETWHFLYVIREMQLKRKGVKLEHAFIALSFSIALFLSMLPTDFKYFLGIEPLVWQWLALTFAIISFVCFVVLLVLWFKNRKPEQTPEEILEKVKKQIVCEELKEVRKE